MLVFDRQYLKEHNRVKGLQGDVKDGLKAVKWDKDTIKINGGVTTLHNTCTSQKTEG